MRVVPDPFSILPATPQSPSHRELDPHRDVDPAVASDRASSDRAAKPQPELDEVAGADGAVVVEVEGEELAAEVLAEGDEVAGDDHELADSLHTPPATSR